MTAEGVIQRCSVKKVFLKFSQNSNKNTCARVSSLIKLQAEACNFSKRETLSQVFSCEFSEIFKNTFFTEHLWPTDSEHVKIIKIYMMKFNARKLYIKRNNNKVDSIETGCVIIADLFP